MGMSRKLVLLLAISAVGCTDYRIHLEDGGDVDGGFVFDAGMPDAGDESDFEGSVCASLGRPVTLVPLDLLVLLDVSGSMDYDLKWVAVKSALVSFVTRDDVAGLGVGLQYFPQRAQCRIDSYETPSVPIGVLPAQSSAIVGSLALQRMSGGTPTVPALTGAVSYVRAYLADPANSGRRAAIVLATDGLPEGCIGADLADAGILANTIDNVAAVAGGAASSAPPVKTFVIGVGTELGRLGEVADAGGTTSAVLVDAMGNAEEQFFNALTRIRHNALGCDFTLPPASAEVDLAKARIRFEPDNGGPVIRVPRRADAAECSTGQGWYFDDPMTPTKVVLCDATCNTITGGNTGTFRVEFACGVN